MSRRRRSVARPGRQRLRLAAPCVAVSLLLAVVAACGEGDVAADRPTATSATDASSAAAPYADAGTDGYDVQSYDVDLSVDIGGSDHIDATTTIVATAATDLTSFSLDLRGLDVVEVTVDGDAADTSSADGRLEVTPAVPVDTGSNFTTVVSYRGDPSQPDDADAALEEGGGWLDVGDYSVVVAEPVGAPTWFPSNDRPSDKALVTVTADVATPLEAVSNGRLLERVERGARTTFRWAADEPMAPYLVTLAVGEFTLTESTLAGGTTVIDAVPPRLAALGEASFGPFPDMVEFFQQRFGAYPFSSAGNVIVPGMPPTALECQTRSVFSVEALDADEGGQLVAHELVHQWFGDAVTPESWQDVWLNEGPAVLGQWMWWEHSGGPTVLESARASYDPGDEALDVPPADPGEAELFGVSVYERSAIFLVELRELMGEAPFLELLSTWVDEHRFGNATTADFVELAGTIHGTSIEALSDPWLYGDELPALSF